MSSSPFALLCAGRASKVRRRRIHASLLSLLLILTLLPVARVTGQDDPAPSAAETTEGAKAPRVEFVPGEALVRFRPESALAAESDSVSVTAPVGAEDGRVIVARIESFDASEMMEGLRLARVPAEDTLAAVAALNARPDVLYAEPNYIWRAEARPNDTQYGNLWALNNTGQTGFNDYATFSASGAPGEDIDAEQAWNTTTGGTGAVVAVLDGGVDVTHPDLQPNIWTNPGEVPNNNLDDDGNGFIDDVNGWDFAHNDKTVFDAEDGDDHATHVAGTIGARGNNGIGVTGVNWNAQIMSVKVLAPSGGSTASIVSGYNYVRTMKERGVNIRVTNNSYGGAGFSQTAFNAIQQLRDAGILFVTSAGNDGLDNSDFPHYPSDYQISNVISVAATDRFGQLAIFSDFGARVVHLGAPGRGILSTVPNFYSEPGVITEANGAKYAYFSGTSMATPQVAGAAALVLAQNPALSMPRLRAALIYSGDPLSSPTYAGKTFSTRRLDARAALENAGDADSTAPSITDFVNASQNGRAVNFQYRAGDDGLAGVPALASFTFNAPNGSQYYLGSFAPSGPNGITQSMTINIPVKQTSGTVALRVIDNAGNEATASLGISVNANAADPYIVTAGDAAALSTGGSPLSLNIDDGYRRNVSLGFSFPYFGQSITSLTVSSNGALYFDRADDTAANDLPNTVAGLNRQNMIAALWDDVDLRTCMRSDADVYMFRPPGVNSVIFRWQGIRYLQETCPASPPAGAAPMNFEVELRADGAIITRYGSGNAAVRPVVGIANGQADATTSGTGDAYIVSSHTSPSTSISLTNAQSITFAPRPAAPTTFRISGRVTGGGVGIDGATVTLSGAQSAQTTTDAFGNYAFDNLPAGAYTLSPSKAGQFVSFARNIALSADQTVDLTLTPFINISGQFSDAQGNAVTGAGYTVSGVPATHAVNSFGAYAVSISPSASAPITITPVKHGYTFTPVSVTYNSTGVGNQVVNFVGALNNPIDGSQNFVRRQYLDFLNREPDAGGLQFWTNGIESCGPVSVPCIEAARVNTSAAFFLSIEFQETGYLVYRMHKAAYGDISQAVPVPVRRAEFIADTLQIGNGVQVGIGNWQQQLESNKTSFADAFAGRARFTTLYPSTLSPAQFVDTLNANAGGALSPSERDSLVNALTGNTMTRAAVLRAVAEDQTLRDAEFNRAFVLMQYFGYLRRDPDAAPDADFAGYNFWLSKLNQFGGNYIQAEMVKAFITSNEYRGRFAP